MSKELTQMDVTELREECRKRGIAAEETATQTDLLTRIVLVDAGQQKPDLPPSGHEREETLKMRTDTLARKIEEEAPEVYPIDEEALKPDREILYDLEHDMLSVSKPQPGFTYCWAYYGQNGQMVWQKKALGWRVVGSDDPECPEHKEADNTRRIGDVLLMKIPTERYELILESQRRRREAQELGVSSEVINYARKHGLKIHEDLSTVKVGANTLMDVMKSKADRQSGAKKVAMSALDKRLREGQVPGVPPGGST
jgi:hypothetical protein